MRRCKISAVTATVIFLSLVTFIQVIISFLISGQKRWWTTLKDQKGLRHGQANKYWLILVIEILVHQHLFVQLADNKKMA